MSELPERLRRLAGDFSENGGSNHPHCKLFDDAADEIERLTRELEAMEDARDIAQAEGALMEMDRDRLRAALEPIASSSRHTRERDEWRHACIGHGEKAYKAELECDRLRAALEEYGRHESPCLGGGGDSRGCSCGFTKALVKE